MKIIVGIPSLNEADSIAHVAESLDGGIPRLRSCFPEAEVTIINVDSSSTDGTVERFLSARVTGASREAVVVEGQPGKGKNILALFRLAVERDASVVITVDADITSITEEWLSLLAMPVLQKSADLVIPRYTRSRYEGSTTNHFAFPLVSSVARFPVRQPIGGDFALSKKLAEELLATAPSPGGEHYGIDIWLSLTAALTGRKISSVYLGKKLHKPSFEKLAIMFPQIASCALFLLKEKCWNPSASQILWIGVKTSTTADTFFRHELIAREMLNVAISDIRDTIHQAPAWLSSDIVGKIDQVIDTRAAPSPKLWALLLSKWLSYGLKKESACAIMAKELLPFFTWRAVSFWFESRSMSEQEVDKYLVHQASIIDTVMLNELTR